MIAGSFRRSLKISCAIVALAIPASALAQRHAAKPPEAGSLDHVIMASGQTLQTTPPPGFESLTAPVDTVFDTYFLGRRIGAFRAVLQDGTLTYSDPAEVAAALDGIVSRDAAMRVLSRPLDLNEQYRCFPGQTTNCGLLPPGQEGAVVDSERFSVELFFAPADVLRHEAIATTLGPAVSGPSLIQNVAFSVANSGGFDSRVRFGGTFDTAASFGQTALLAQTVADDQQGVRLNDGIVQHVWSDRIAQAGLFEDFSTRLLTSYRMVGAEFGSFYPSKAYDAGIATPIQIVLPREADVELRRQGVLVSVRHYQAGLQTLDTSGLPDGSYPLTITARAQGTIVFQDVRSFTRAAGLPIQGKTEFSVRAGFYAADRFQLDQNDEHDPFIPHLDGAPVFGARLARRIGKATGAEINVLDVDNKNYVEGSLTTYRGTLQGFVSAAVGDDGSYGVLVTGTKGIGDIRLSVTGRYTHSDLTDFDLADFNRRGDYQPFVRSERSVFGTASFPFLQGSASVSASYSHFDGVEDEYSVDVRYTRALQIARRQTLLSVFARGSTRDTRVGFTFSLDFGVDRHTTASVLAGGEVVPSSDGPTRKGVSPILNATLSRRDTVGSAALVSQAGVSTDADSDRAFASTDLTSSFGQFDVTGQYQQTRGAGNFSSLFANGQTGFAIGGGAVKVGLAQPGQAVILSDISAPTDQVKGKDRANSGYRVKLNNQSADLLTSGHISAVGVTPYADYDVALEPENAPAYEIDQRPRTITVYPGNVVRMHYEATHNFSLFGQLVDTNGMPISGGRVIGGDDLSVTDDHGYFTITAPGTAMLDIRTATGAECEGKRVSDLTGPTPSLLLNRVGQLVCHPAAAPEAPVEKPAAPSRKARADARVDGGQVIGLLSIARKNIQAM